MKAYLHLIVISAFLLILGAGCGNDDTITILMHKDKTVSFTTEMAPHCWFNELTLQRKITHTGRYASKIDASYPYSFGFKEKFAEIDSLIPRKVDIGFWILARGKGTNADLVVSIDSAETNKFWIDVSLKDSIIKADEWQPVRCRLTLPKRIIKPEDKIGIYLWGKDSGEFYMDDLAVRFEY